MRTATTEMQEAVTGRGCESWEALLRHEESGLVHSSPWAACRPQLRGDAVAPLFFGLFFFFLP